MFPIDDVIIMKISSITNYVDVEAASPQILMISNVEIMKINHKY